MIDYDPGPVLIATPTGAESTELARILFRVNVTAFIHANLEDLVLAVESGTGAILLAEESLDDPALDALLAYLEARPPWCDLPILCLSPKDPSVVAAGRPARRHELADQLTIIERPFRPETLVSAVRTGLRARIRQWQVRDLLSQRNEAAEARGVSEDRLRVATDAAGIGIWEVTSNLSQLIWDDRCQAHFGQLPGTPVTYERFLGCLHPEDRERVERAIATCVAPGASELYDIEYRTIGLHDKVERWIAASGRTFTDPITGITRFIGVTMDITRRKLAEADLLEAKSQAEAANAAKDDFIAALSHELRTPLTPILMCLSFRATQPGLPADLREDLAMIKRNVELEARLIDDLLDLTRVVQGKLELRLEPVECHPLLESVREICGASPNARANVAIRIEFSATAHRVKGDRTRLQQIVWNLVQNAVKFSDTGGTVIIQTSNPRPGRLAIRVTDTGKGIPDHQIESIFNAFEQGGRDITNRFGGLGLGLAIARALVESHGGTIEAKSGGAGQGATFTVEFDTLPSLAAPESQSDAHAPPNADHLDVLFVEDHESTLAIFSRLMTRAGHNVSTATNLAEARQLLAASTFDLLITDLGLPDGSGLELIDCIDQSRTASIALSGFGMNDDVQRCRDAGFTRHLTKPIDWELLGDHITAAVTENADRRQLQNLEPSKL